MMASTVGCVPKSHFFSPSKLMEAQFFQARTELHFIHLDLRQPLRKDYDWSKSITAVTFSFVSDYFRNGHMSQFWSMTNMGKCDFPPPT